MVDPRPMPVADHPPVLTPLAFAVPAPLLWRVLALFLDCSLAGFAAWVILVRLVLPQTHPNAAGVINDQMNIFYTEYQRVQATGDKPKFELSDEAIGIFQDAGNTFFLTLLVYFSASELATAGTTLGKRVFGLRTARWFTGEPPRPIESLTRSLFKVASLLFFWPFLLLVNTLPALAHASRRAGHDHLARTCVTRTPLPARVADHRYPADDEE